MAYYSYKHVRDLIPSDFQANFEKQWLEDTGRAFENAADYDGDLWILAAYYIEHLKSLVKQQEGK